MTPTELVLDGHAGRQCYAHHSIVYLRAKTRSTWVSAPIAQLGREEVPIVVVVIAVLPYR